MVPEPPHRHIYLLFFLSLKLSKVGCDPREVRGRKKGEVIVGLGATLDEKLLGGPVGELSIPAVSNLTRDLLAFCSLILSKAECISAMTSSGKPSQTTTSLHTTRARWCFNLFMPPYIVVG